MSVALVAIASVCAFASGFMLARSVDGKLRLQSAALSGCAAAGFLLCIFVAWLLGDAA